MSPCKALAQTLFMTCRKSLGKPVKAHGLKHQEYVKRSSEVCLNIYS